MEANKAPEKIYLEEEYPNNGTLPNGLNYSPKSTDIEYVRTDVIAQRVKDFLYDQLLLGNIECGNIMELIENFKKRIKE